MDGGAPVRRVRSRDGTEIAFSVSGAGPPLVLVHGATADRQRWATVSSQLEHRFTLYAMDRRGRGGSGDGPDYALLREAEDVAAVAEAVGEPVDVLGHSFGGLVSLEAALLTDWIRRLVLYEPPLPSGKLAIPAEVIERMQTLIDRGEPEAALEVMMREVVEMPEHELAAYRRLPMWQRRIAVVPTVPRELAIEQTWRFDPVRFAELQTPTLLLLGADSPAAVHRDTERLHAALPDSRVVVLPDQQHVAMDMDPELFASAVVRFLLDG